MAPDVGEWQIGHSVPKMCVKLAKSSMSVFSSELGWGLPTSLAISGAQLADSVVILINLWFSLAPDSARSVGFFLPGETPADP